MPLSSIENLSLEKENIGGMKQEGKVATRVWGKEGKVETRVRKMIEEEPMLKENSRRSEPFVYSLNHSAFLGL